MILRIITAACILLLNAPAFAGPLDPPAGPIVPTPGPEPRIAINDVNTPGTANAVYRITQPGSYYLTQNLIGRSGKAGLRLEVTGAVSIDLNGFSVVGVSGALEGIVISSVTPSATVTVRNGSISGWEVGINFIAGDASMVVEGVNCRSNGAGALVVSAIVTECDFSRNGSFGLTALQSLVVRCSAESNSGLGIVADSTEVRDCRAQLNGTNGFASNGNSTYVGCTARANGEKGFNIASGSALLTGCVAEDNGLDGFHASTPNSATTVRHCIARFNTANGIRVVSGGVIEGNTLYNNGTPGSGAGILVVGSDNRIEGNNCIGADFGIKVDGAGNIILRNTCSGNTTNWSIAIGNAVAPIVAASVNGVPIVGNSFAGSLGSTDPNANFTY